MDIIKDSVNVKQLVGNTRKNIVIEQDYIIPDIKPDVINIITTNGNIYVNKREGMSNKVKLDGGVNVYISYTADNGDTRSLNTEVTFDEIIEINEAEPDSIIDDQITIKTMETRILNERKVSLKIQLDANVRIFKESKIELVKDISNVEKIQKLEKEMELKNLVGRGNTKASIKENIKIDDVDDLSEILKADMEVSNCDTKISYNKVLAKADYNVNLMYLTEDNRICFKNASIPIMGFVDIINVNDTNLCDVDYKVKNIMIKPNSKEEHSVYLEAEFDIFCDVYEMKKINVIQDAYGIKEDLKFNNKNISIASNDKNIIQNVDLSEKVLIEDINQVYDASISVDITNKTNKNGMMVYSAEANVNYLYSSFDNNGLNSKLVKIGFNFETYESNDVNINFSIKSKNIIVLPDSSVDTKISIEVATTNSSNLNLKVIDDIEMTELEEDDGFSMIIYFTQKGDSLWKIAKKFRSTVDEIVRVNNIEDANKIDVGERLYIPKAV